MADERYSTARQLIINLREYLLPNQATAEDVVNLWTDPVTRGSANRLPFFLLEVPSNTLENMQFLLGKTKGETAVNYFNVYPFELISEEGGISKIKLYIKSLQSVWQSVGLTSQNIPFSQKSRVVVYRETPLDVVNLRLLIYNTLMTPWLDIYSELLQEAVKRNISQGTSIQLSVPKAFSGNDTIWDDLTCTVSSMAVADKFANMALLSLSLLVEPAETKTTYRNYTTTQ